MHVWTVVEVEPKNPGEDYPRMTVHRMLRSKSQALDLFNELCWEYSVEDEAFGGEVAEIVMGSQSKTPEELKEFYDQVWHERFEEGQDSRFQILYGQLF